MSPNRLPFEKLGRTDIGIKLYYCLSFKTSTKARKYHFYKVNTDDKDHFKI